MTVKECFDETARIGGECLPPTYEVFFGALSRALFAVMRLFPEKTVSSLPVLSEETLHTPLPISEEGAALLPLRVAAEVFYAEDAGLADRCLSLYAADAQSVFSRRREVPSATVVGNGW